jgi:hypothetical protein
MDLVQNQIYGSAVRKSVSDVGLAENNFCIFMNVEEKGIRKINRLKITSDCVKEEQ